MSDLVPLEQLQQWVGKSNTTIDTVTAAPVASLAATLDHATKIVEEGHPLQALWHWLYLLPKARQSDIGPDGHAEKGGFLPPVPLPRRMWAGSQLDFHHPIYVGDTIERLSSIDSIQHKTGNSGELVFVRVKHQIDRINHSDGSQKPSVPANRIPAITEYHDIVYRQAPQADETPRKAKPAPATADWEHSVDVDDVLLFRYSALTFNGHRIHYDRRYVTEVEGYPGLIVHGPLIATMLIDAMRSELNDPIITHFAFRAIQPVFDTHPFFVCGAVSNANDNENKSKASTTKVLLWAKNHLGELTMQAEATVLEKPSA